MNNHKWTRIACMALIMCLGTIATAKAQNRTDSLYAESMKKGQLFLKSGNLHKAELFFNEALNHAQTLDIKKQLEAQLSLVDVTKSWKTLEAQRINKICRNSSASLPEYRQRYLTMNMFISFFLNDKYAFESANSEYRQLCIDHQELPTSNDRAIQAMYEAINGFYDEALRTLNTEEIDVLTRHDMRMNIYRLNGNYKKAFDEQKLRAVSVDSLNAALYDSIISEITSSTEQELINQLADKQKSRTRNIIITLIILVILITAIWLYLRHKMQKDIVDKNTQMQMALKMASETETMKDEFVKRINHEIRTPLNAVAGFNDILNNSDIELSKEERDDLIARINENIKAITYITDELLQSANDKSTEEYEKNDTLLCNQFFSELLYKHDGEVSADIELKYTPHVLNRLTIKTNAKTISNIVDHLIHNAIKFTHKGIIELSCSKQNNMVVLTISDSGCGIPEDQHATIFEQFKKADSNQQGIGLGLSVSKNLAQKMGGDLILDENYHNGARFILTIPIK